MMTLHEYKTEKPHVRGAPFARIQILAFASPVLFD
jgi:hypothetical protein